jgi:carboxymethylenebutenolidase
MRFIAFLLSTFILLTAAFAQDPVVVTLKVPASPLQAYNALTVDWQIRQWSPAIGVTFNARLDGAWSKLHSSGHVEQGIVQAADRGQRLVYTQLFDTVTTQVSVIFRPLADSTEIAIVHTVPKGSDPALRDTIQALWQSTIPRLRLYLTDYPGGYLARPRGEGPFPAVLVLHDRFGLNRTAKALCDSLAQQGYLALAADMFRGEVTGDLTQAAQYLGAVDHTQAYAAAKRGLSTLVSYSKAGSPPRAVWGIGFGGGYALELAAEDAGLKAVVLWQDAVLPEVDKLSRIGSPILCVFGSPDDKNPRAEIAAMNQAFVQAGVRIDMSIYPGGREFSDPAYGQTYNQLAVDRAYGQTLAFLFKYLH